MPEPGHIYVSSHLSQHTVPPHGVPDFSVQLAWCSLTGVSLSQVCSSQQLPGRNRRLRSDYMTPQQHLYWDEQCLPKFLSIQDL